MWKRASPPSRAGPSCLYCLPVKSLVKFVFVYMRGGPALLSEISLLTTRDLAEKGWKFSILTDSERLALLLRTYAGSSSARRGRKFPCKGAVKFSPLTSPNKRAGSPPYKRFHWLKEIIYSMLRLSNMACTKLH